LHLASGSGRQHELGGVGLPARARRVGRPASVASGSGCPRNWRWS